MLQNNPSQYFYYKGTLARISRSQGTTAKVSPVVVIVKIPLTLVGVSGNNAHLAVVVKMTPLKPCLWLCQVVLDLELCRLHNIGGQLATAQGTPGHLWRNPRVPQNPG